MHTCSFCKDPVPGYSKPSKAHLTIGMDEDGHIHTHGNLENKDAMQEMFEVAANTIGLDSKTAPAKELPKEIIFRNRQRIGDILMFTCAVRDFKKSFPNTRVNILSTCQHIWDNNPNVDRSVQEFHSDGLKKRLAEYNDKIAGENKSLPKEKQKKPKKLNDFITQADLLSGDTNVLNIGPSRGTNQSGRIDWHFSNAFRISIEDSLGIKFQQGESRPDIYFTESEYNSERPFKDPYWVICVSGEKSWGCKMYPFERWQKVVNDNPDIKFVQIGALEDDPPRLQGANVIDHVGKTQDKLNGIRDLFKLFLHAEGSIGLVSFHMHLSGALYKPAVVVAGAREPVSFTRFPYHQYLATDGTLPCSVPACWHCGIETCTNLIQYPDKLEKQVPKCVDMIPAEEVTQAIRRYYIGGRLKLGHPSDKPGRRKRDTDQGVSVIPDPIIAPAPAPEGFDWGKGAIDPIDWPFIEEVIKKHQVRTVLEFGAGLSTKLISEMVDSIYSFETEKYWADKVALAAPKAHIFKWNGRELPGHTLAKEYDMAFVDGPANGQNREEATRLAANHAKIVILHDATRDNEAKWEAKYLKPGFQGPIKGGKWCHMWIKTPSFVSFAPPPPTPTNPNKKRIRIVSTARGWGGCARSITTMMKMLLQGGHDVEFVPFHKEVSSREIQDCLKNGLASVKVSTSFDTIREQCDVLLVYADDFVWEFPKLENDFSDLQAKKKIMVVNYRRGKIGEVPWTKSWDKYMFLNTAQQRSFLQIDPKARTKVLPPCADLSSFFDQNPNFDGEEIRIVRHNSQGDTKFSKNFGDELANAHDSRQDISFHMMPGPSFIQPANRFFKYPRNTPPVPKFLASGHLFWYSLPEGYMDMGPRVILEAMAVGLPILADNWGGAVDRVTPECGWLCDTKDEMLSVIKNVTMEELKQKGKAAKERAIKEFRAERWIEELVGEPVYA